MCSTCDCDQIAEKLGSGTTSIVDQATSTTTRTCRKCGSNPYIILDKVHVECKQCFLESCNKKVRSTIGKSKLIRNNDSVLIAYSGGPSSSALLDLISNSISAQSKREQKLIPSILHVDVQSIFVTNPDDKTSFDRLHRLRLLLSNLSQTYKGWPIYWTTLEVATILSQETPEDNSPLFARFDPGDDLILAGKHLLDNNDSYKALHANMANHEDLTDRQQYLQDLCDHLINTVASQVNSSLLHQSHQPDQQFKYVFTGHSATQLANNLLVDVILGKGSTLRSAVSICDTRPAIALVRPMRDFSKKEIAFYLNARDINLPFVEQNLLTFASRKSSIQTVTESFLSKLYVDYPSTYSTLLRTGNKLQN